MSVIGADETQRKTRGHEADGVKAMTSIEWYEKLAPITFVRLRWTKNALHRPRFEANPNNRKRTNDKRKCKRTPGKIEESSSTKTKLP